MQRHVSVHSPHMYQFHTGVLHLLRLALALCSRRRCCFQPLLSRLLYANQGFIGQGA